MTTFYSYNPAAARLDSIEASPLPGGSKLQTAQGTVSALYSAQHPFGWHATRLAAWNAALEGLGRRSARWALGLAEARAALRAAERGMATDREIGAGAAKGVAS